VRKRSWKCGASPRSRGPAVPRSPGPINAPRIAPMAAFPQRRLALFASPRPILASFIAGHFSRDCSPRASERAFILDNSLIPIKYPAFYPFLFIRLFDKLYSRERVESFFVHYRFFTFLYFFSTGRGNTRQAFLRQRYFFSS
jgi:hypothetical protein